MQDTGKRVLVVDDDDGDKKFLRRLLSRCHGIGSIAELSSGQEALGLKDSDYDAVFLDHYLAGSTGLSFLPEMREKWPRAAIFLMTGQGDEMVAKTAIKNGATDYFSKGYLTEDSLAGLLVTGIAAADERWRIEQQRIDLATFSEVLIHDFKAPIRAAAFLAEQIGEDLDAGEMGEVQNGLQLLKKSADQMNAMIRSLSDHIRLDREVEFLHQPPEQLFEVAMTSLALVLSESGARIQKVVDADIPPIMCNGPQISQVLQNLVANAVKFSRGPEPVVTVKILNHSDQVVFEVTDQGMGISPEHIESIFLPFKRAPGVEAVAGTGLGLATCRKIILRHKGRIWCQSVLGHGTTMSFALPILSPALVGTRTSVANFDGFNGRSMRTVNL